MSNSEINILISNIISENAEDIIKSNGMESEKGFMQHGYISCYEHSVRVARISVLIAIRLHFRVNMRSLVRGALLHDYFLYDWHVPDKSHRLHGFIHARLALKNAERDFALDSIERDIIEKHMFPMNPMPPRYAESYIVMIADKVCAARETLAPLCR